MIVSLRWLWISFLTVSRNVRNPESRCLSGVAPFRLAIPPVVMRRHAVAWKAVPVLEVFVALIVDCATTASFDDLAAPDTRNVLHFGNRDSDAPRDDIA